MQHVLLRLLVPPTLLFGRGRLAARLCAARDGLGPVARVVLPAHLALLKVILILLILLLIGIGHVPGVAAVSLGGAGRSVGAPTPPPIRGVAHFRIAATAAGPSAPAALFFILFFLLFVFLFLLLLIPPAIALRVRDPRRLVVAGAARQAPPHLGPGHRACLRRRHLVLSGPSLLAREVVRIIVAHRLLGRVGGGGEEADIAIVHGVTAAAPRPAAAAASHRVRVPQCRDALHRKVARARHVHQLVRAQRRAAHVSL